ncbi:hypothetical protein ATCCBAA256_10150 [Mycobacterium montefiorense]|nr:hypothetical protein ATCCBAA256_10150 [Mycobacterium montefiorense]
MAKRLGDKGVFGSADAMNGSLVKDNNFRCVLRGQVEAVQRSNDADLQRRTKFEHFNLMFWIQVIGRFIEHQNLWLLGQRPGEEDALPFTTGKRGNRTIRQGVASAPMQAIINDFFIVRAEPTKCP